MRARSLSLLGVLVLLTAGCGSAGSTTSSSSKRSFVPSHGSNSPSLSAELRDAEHPSRRDFPPVGGRTLQALANTLKPGPQVGLAASVLLPGENRVAFGLIGPDQKFIYGRSAVYVARSPRDTARGPFVAPADSVVPSRPFLSKTAAADTADIKAIYATQVAFKRPGTYSLLIISNVGGKLLGGTSQLKVRATSPIPRVGARAPRISTDTVASAHGNLNTIDTRIPHDDMHTTNFRDVIGRKPVVLLFSTPQLCQSRVCGPVTDLELELEHTYGKRAAFIHEEVYVGNQVNQGLRPQLRAFHLQTEPWLFTFDRTGRVAARLEGAFGINAFRAAVTAALR